MSSAHTPPVAPVLAHGTRNPATQMAHTPIGPRCEASTTSQGLTGPITLCSTLQGRCAPTVGGVSLQGALENGYGRQPSDVGPGVGLDVTRHAMGGPPSCTEDAGRTHARGVHLWVVRS